MVSMRRGGRGGRGMGGRARTHEMMDSAQAGGEGWGEWGIGRGTCRGRERGGEDSSR